MKQAPEELTEIVSWMGDRLRTAAAMVIDRLGTAEVRAKGRGDVVTDADTALEEWFLDQLGRSTPSWGVVAEESYERELDASTGRWWVLDPLDGTVNFATGVPFFAISLALLDTGFPVAAAVIDPLRGELFEARIGAGAKVNGRAIGAGQPPSTVRSLAVSSGLVSELSCEGSGGVLRRILEVCPKLRNLGAQTLHLCYVACGRLGAALSVEARIWDDAAGALIASEAGARYTGLDGQPLFPVRRTGDCMRSLAAESRVHSQILAITTEIEMKGYEL